MIKNFSKVHQIIDFLDEINNEDCSQIGAFFGNQRILKKMI